MSKETKVYVYNPIRDLTGERALMFDGKLYEFPKGKVTVLEDQHFQAPDLYRRNMANASPAEKKAVHEYDLDATTFANTIFRRQYVDMIAAGIFIGSKEPTVEEKKACDKRAEQWKRAQIDEFQQERMERQSGGKGRLSPDVEMIEWMEELGIEDKLYNPLKGGMPQEDLVAMGAAIGKSVAEAMKAEPVGARK